MSNTNYIVTIMQNSNPSIVVEAPMPDSFAFDAGATYEQMLPQGLTGNKVINTAAAVMGTKLAVQALTAQLWSGSADTELSMELEFHTETDPYNDVRTPIVNLLKLTMPSIDTKSGFLGAPGPYIDFTKAGVAGSILSTAVISGISGAESLLGAVAGGVGSVLSGLGSAVFGSTPTPSAMNDSNTTPNGGNSALTSSLAKDPTLGTAKYWNTLVNNKISISIGNYLYFDSVVITRVSQTFASNFDAQTGLPHDVRVVVSFKPLFMLAQEDLDTLFVNPAGGAASSSALFGISMPNPSSVAGGGAVTGGNAYGFTG
jgi:hypothetical protein